MPNNQSLRYIPTVSAPSRASVNLQLHGAVLSTELTLNMITVVLDRSASNYIPSTRKTPLQERSHKMLVRQKRDAKAQTSYWRGVYGTIRAALEARIKHNTLERVVLLLATFRSIPGFTYT